MWLEELKIAVVEEDVEKIDFLMQEPPKLEDAQEIDSARTLIDEALKILTKLRSESEKSMQKIKKNIEFLNATELHPNSRLDIIS